MTFGSQAGWKLFSVRRFCHHGRYSDTPLFFEDMMGRSLDCKVLTTCIHGSGTTWNRACHRLGIPPEFQQYPAVKFTAPKFRARYQNGTGTRNEVRLKNDWKMCECTKTLISVSGKAKLLVIRSRLAILLVIGCESHDIHKLHKRRFSQAWPGPVTSHSVFSLLGKSIKLMIDLTLQIPHH